MPRLQFRTKNINAMRILLIFSIWPGLKIDLSLPTKTPSFKSSVVGQLLSPNHGAKKIYLFELF